MRPYRQHGGRWLAILSMVLATGCATAPAGEGQAPRISNMRFEGLKIQDNMYFSSSEFGRDYVILVDFESPPPIQRVLLQTRFADGRTSRVLDRGFEVLPGGATRGTLRIPSRILSNRIARDTDWWVEDANGRISNKLTQHVVIRD